MGSLGYPEASGGKSGIDEKGETQLSFLFGGGKSKEEKRLAGAQQRATQLGISGAEKDIPAAREAIAPLQKFFQALLTGDRTALLDVLGPEVSTVSSQYETGRRAAEEFAPRGGGRAAALEELPFRKEADITRLVQGARRTGAAGMEDVANFFASLGLGELGTGAQVAGVARGQAFDERQFQAQQQQQAGQAAGAMIALLMAGA